MADITLTVGLSGRTYTTLQAAWVAIPSTVAAGDNYYITIAAGLYTSGLNVSAAPKTINGAIYIAPEAGAAWYEQAGALTGPIRYDNTKGVVFESAPFGLPCIMIQNRVHVKGLQVRGGSTYGCISCNDNGTLSSISRCITYADVNNTYCVSINAYNGLIYNNFFFTTHTTNPPIRIGDTNGFVTNFIGNTIIKVGGGGGTWNAGQYGNDLRVKDCLVLGFSGTGTTFINSANSSNNATDLASFPGSNNLVNLVAASQLVDPTNIATLDMRVKAGNGLQFGVVNATIPIDALGTTRGTPPTIGANEYVAVVADTTVPIMTGTMTSNTVTSSGFVLDWSATTRSDNIGITGYETSINGAAYVSAALNTNQVFSGLAASTAYTLTARAFDAAGNRSTPALSLVVNTSAPSSDVTLPTLSGSITPSSIASTSFDISWPTGSDNVGVVGYKVSKDGGSTYTTLGNVTTYSFTGLTPSTAYGVRVKAYDGAGNESSPVLSASVTTTAAPDTTLPVLTGSITSSAITTTGFTVSWPAASDNVAVTGYKVSRDGGSTYTTLGNVLTYAYTGLTSSTTYQVRVKAFDAAGNESTPVLSTSVTTATVVGTITSTPMKNGTKTLIPNLTGLTVTVLDMTTLGLIKNFTNVSTNASAVYTLTDALIVAGTEYVTVVKNAAKVLGIEGRTAT